MNRAYELGLEDGQNSDLSGFSTREDLERNVPESWAEGAINALGIDAAERLCGHSIDSEEWSGWWAEYERGAKEGALHQWDQTRGESTVTS